MVGLPSCRRRVSGGRASMSDRAKRLLDWVLFVVVFLIYAGGECYCRRHPPFATPSGTVDGS